MRGKEDYLMAYPARVISYPHGHHLVVNHEKKAFYVVHKKDVFRSFGKIFHKEEEQGESINEEALKIACMEKALVVFVYSMKIRTIDAQEFLMYAMKNNTLRYEEKTFERTASVPLSLLQEMPRW